MEDTSIQQIQAIPNPPVFKKIGSINKCELVKELNSDFYIIIGSSVLQVNNNHSFIYDEKYSLILK